MTEAKKEVKQSEKLKQALNLLVQGAHYQKERLSFLCVSLSLLYDLIPDKDNEGIQAEIFLKGLRSIVEDDYSSLHDCIEQAQKAL